MSNIHNIHIISPIDGEWYEDLKCQGGVAVTSSLEKVYICDSQAKDFSVSCYTLDRKTRAWCKLFTTEPNTDKILMLSLTADERSS